MTKTYKSTSSYGKKMVEKNWLIPIIQSLNTNPAPNGLWIGVLGAPDGVIRHIKNAVDCGIALSNQHYVENDLSQFNIVSKEMTSNVIYKHKDVVDYTQTLLSCGHYISVIDADLCERFSDTHRNLLQLMVDYRDQVDILVLTMCLRGSRKEKTQTWFISECQKVGLTCCFKSYLGKGSKQSQRGGMPILLVVISK